MIPNWLRLGNKLATVSTTALVTCALLFFIFAGVAALDELARLPFYHTLPVACVLVNAAWLLLLFHNKGHIRIVSRTLARLVSTSATLFRQHLGSDGTQQPSYRNSSHLGEGNSNQSPSAESIEAALQKIHSVVWSFPGRNSFVTKAMRAEGVSDEARQ
jgi:hypothetical protein